MTLLYVSANHGTKDKMLIIMDKAAAVAKEIKAVTDGLPCLSWLTTFTDKLTSMVDENIHKVLSLSPTEELSLQLLVAKKTFVKW